ncbi:hypothetical protein DUNSADRAFT_1976 [Dunaliella salina]|uniref:Encoded protein n=1 Tax=Dunaliella salina TaxID=3046 RepID=A0ABQ7FWR0_DUNSA|nr:hypothetical protein DUNSADRAFT_1976 [Dunaliella salina]|eukprot:KAF5826805.1 hypothetical protein DUNSADRAFT_1976 [Dunaliella salina]
MTTSSLHSRKLDTCSLLHTAHAFHAGTHPPRIAHGITLLCRPSLGSLSQKQAVAQTSHTDSSCAFRCVNAKYAQPKTVHPPSLNCEPWRAAHTQTCLAHSGMYMLCFPSPNLCILPT